jgi:CheY-like chemotaxis protein
MVIAVVDDMIFIAKIRAVAESVNVTVRFVRNSESLFAAAMESTPSLIIVDLQSQKVAPLELAIRLKSDAGLRAIPLLGFYSHVETALRDQAEAAGYDRIMPRSAFSTNLAQVLAPS